VVIDATGASIADVWVKALGYKGRLVLQGWYPEPVAFNQHAYHLRLASVHFPCGYTQPGIRAGLDALGRGNLHIKPLISHVVPAQEAQAAYDMMLDTPGQVLGMVFTWGEQ
jgi:threonine dehydrogenase-like Zn-dependent dehydrogenase